MVTIIQSSSRVARKTHQFNACLFLFEADYRNLGATFSEYRAIKNALDCNGIIKAGERYESVSVDDDGKIYRYAQKPEINEICLKYDLYFE